MTWRTPKIQKKDEYGEAALWDDTPLFFSVTNAILGPCLTNSPASGPSA